MTRRNAQPYITLARCSECKTTECIEITHCSIAAGAVAVECLSCDSSTTRRDSVHDAAREWNERNGHEREPINYRTAFAGFMGGVIGASIVALVLWSAQ